METNRTITVSAVVVHDTAGRLLTVRKRGTERFMHPGGKPEPGETPARTAARELAEELGLHVSPDELVHRGRVETPTANEPGFLLVAEVFAVPRAVDAAEVAAHAEIAELRWVDPAELGGLDETDCAPWAPLLTHAVAR